MAWTNPRTWNIGELVTKAIMDTHIRDNLLALWPFTAAGDIAYATAADSLTRLAKGSAYDLLRMNAGATGPEYGGAIPKRQGGNASDWGSPGTTTYTPARSLMQVGVKSGTTGGAVNHLDITVTFPVAFSNRPIVLVTEYEAGGHYTWLIKVTASSTGCVISVYFDTTYASEPVTVQWLAIGPP